MASRRVWLWWSSGKDSAWALHELRRRRGCAVEALVTTVNERFGRVAMHAVRETLLERQAERAGLALHRVPIPHPCSNRVYEAAARAAIETARGQGITHMAFGDLFLTEIRSYREALLAGSGVEPIFPIWGRDTADLAEEMVASGLRARVTCVDPRRLPAELAGAEYDRRFLAALPPDVDPCGENGEFHTFAYAGPMFDGAVPVRTGERVERDGFVFADLVGATSDATRPSD